MGLLRCLPTFVVFVLMAGNNLYNVSKDTAAVSGGSACSLLPPTSLCTMFSKVLRLKAKEVWVDRGLRFQASLPPALN